MSTGPVVLGVPLGLHRSIPVSLVRVPAEVWELLKPRRPFLNTPFPPFNRAIILPGALLLLLGLATQAQPGNGPPTPPAAAFSITATGPHHRVWVREEVEPALMVTKQATAY